ncbi:type II toxin-antitoxin system HipA family toxin YjjJ [Candidatus Spongiihabitans sp.]|uniref:type II toxin-antitoxin system HipA family toxin YjjJ n=1 Tax=Candidatus Spongiihabitans sp. TaxID=3101308 RepID=UPI003C7A1BFB
MTIVEFLSRGPATSRQIQAALSLTQSAVSRRLRALGDRIVTLGRSRPPVYAATRNAFGGDDLLPLFMVDANGDAVPVAMVRPLAHGGFLVMPTTGSPGVLAGIDGNGVYADLPYFLQDLRPQGFLGRLLARELAAVADEFPADPRRWTSNHIGRYLIAAGDDLPGNFKFGRQTRLRPRQRPAACAPADYPKLADQALSGQTPASSAGGEQPKFTAYSGDRGAHVIVKFSPTGDDAAARRWRDILITEFYAAEVLRAGRLPAADTRLLEQGGRLFLESIRFDRSGEHGRLPMISLQAVDAEFVGFGDGWGRVMRRLSEAGLVNFKHADDVELLEHFGHLINNSDMHLGNLSLGIEGDVFRLLPVYDMCSMGFAPTSAGVSPYRFTPPTITRSDFPRHTQAARLHEMVEEFWGRVAADERISGELRTFIAGRAADLGGYSSPQLRLI